MPPTPLIRKPVVDWLTVVAISAMAISLTVGFHEGIHALTCIAVGGELLEYSALYESCRSYTVLQAKLVAGSAPTFNLIAGTILWAVLRKLRKQSAEARFFLWIFMLMNWCYGAGYFIFSGITDVGDWAVVIDSWRLPGLWRSLMTIAGVLLFIVLIRLSLKELGKMIGGNADEQIRRAGKLCTLAYLTSALIVLAAGFFCPHGLLSTPVAAGLCAALGALSPLLWMMRWFRTRSFRKWEAEPLEIRRKWQWLFASAVVVFSYVFVLGRTLYF